MVNVIFDDDFEWDAEKNESNLEKHGFTFEEALLIFTGDTLVIEDRRNPGEIRYIAIGPLTSRTMLTVVFTRRQQRRRLISAREATPNEQNRYYARFTQRRR
jgi:uncharacterized DUF497 family protein